MATRAPDRRVDRWIVTRDHGAWLAVKSVGHHHVIVFLEEARLVAEARHVELRLAGVGRVLLESDQGRVAANAKGEVIRLLLDGGDQ
jgi:hypothetical protein